MDSVESLDLVAENESLKKQNEELHQLLANQQSDYANLSNQLSNQNEKLVDAKEATETRFETLFNNLQQRNELDQVPSFKGNRTFAVTLRRFIKFKAQKSSKANEGMLIEKIQNLDDEGKLFTDTCFLLAVL